MTAMPTAPAAPVTVHVDMVRPGRGLVTFKGLDLGGGIIAEDGRWLAENADGVVVGTAQRSKGAAVRLLADYYGVVGVLRVEFAKEYGDLSTTVAVVAPVVRSVPVVDGRGRTWVELQAFNAEADARDTEADAAVAGLGRAALERAGVEYRVAAGDHGERARARRTRAVAQRAAGVLSGAFGAEALESEADAAQRAQDDALALVRAIGRALRGV